MVTLQLALCIVMMNVRWRFAHLWRLLSTADQLYTMVTPNKCNACQKRVTRE